MPTAPTPVAAAPTTPDRADRTTFPTRMYNFFVHIAGAFTSGINALGTNAYNNAVDSYNSAADAASSASAASSSAGTATTQAGVATTQAGIATTQAGLAAASEVAAAASAASAAAIANAFIGTSSTSWTPATGSKAFTTQAGELYTAGIYVTVVSAGTPSAKGWGQVTSYSGTTLTVDVQQASGSGSHTDWNISMSGAQGPQGADGVIDASSLASTTHAATTKTTPVDADELPIVDSEASNGLKKLTWANLKATAKAYFDTLYGALASVQTWTAAQRGAYVTLTDAATIAVNLALANFFRVQLGGNRTLGAATNIVEGQSGQIDVYQDGTGSRTLAYAWMYQFASGTAPTLTTGKYTKDVLAYTVAKYASANVTISNASPGVVTWNSHGLLSGQQIQLTTTGGLPTGLSASTSYWVTTIDANTYKLSTSLANAQAGTFINTSSAGSGTHTCTAATIMVSALGDVK